MIRNLKALGLALVALFAMSAVVASAASAEEPTNGTMTADGPFYLTGEDEASGNRLVYPGESPVSCEVGHYIGEKYRSSAPIPSGSSTLTVTPTYEECSTESGLYTTVTMNGCDYEFHIGETTGEGNTYSLTSGLECSGGVVEVEVYSGAGEGLRLCKITFGTQTGLSGATVSETGTNTAVVAGTFGGIKASKSGLCSAGSTEAAEYEVNVKLEGENEEGGTTHVSLSH